MKFNKQGIVRVNRKNMDSELIANHVDYLISLKTPTNPFDYIFGRNIPLIPNETFDAYKLPGLFDGVKLTDVFLDGGDKLSADSLMHVLPDMKTLKHEAYILMEQETGFISDSKLKKIFKYWLYFITFHQKLCIPFIATNYDYEQDFIIKKFDNFIFGVNLLNYNNEKITEVLNILKEKNYHEDYFTTTQYALFIQCLVHAKKPYAYDVMMELVNIFQSIDYISIHYQKELASSLVVLVKYHFKEDINKIRRLISMIVESMDRKVYGELPNLVDDKLELIRMHEEISAKNKKISSLSDEISANQEEISSLSDEISANQEEISSLILLSFLCIIIEFGGGFIEMSIIKNFMLKNLYENGFFQSFYFIIKINSLSSL